MFIFLFFEYNHPFGGEWPSDGRWRQSYRGNGRDDLIYTYINIHNIHIGRVRWGRGGWTALVARRRRCLTCQKPRQWRCKWTTSRRRHSPRALQPAFFMRVQWLYIELYIRFKLNIHIIYSACKKPPNPRWRFVARRVWRGAVDIAVFFCTRRKSSPPLESSISLCRTGYCFVSKLFRSPLLPNDDDTQ